MNLTITGADETTPKDAIAQILSDSPGHPMRGIGQVEIGILYSLSQPGRPRYPDLPWIMEQIIAFPSRIALHVCGSMARHSIQHLVPDFRGRISRLQINGKLTRSELDDFCDLYAGTPVISQHNEQNQHLLACQKRNHQILIDRSGGRGQLPSSWTAPETNKPLGFAGGLAPTNIHAQLPWIRHASTRAHLDNSQDWVDLESGVRDQEDRFSVHLAWQMTNHFAQAWLAGHMIGEKS